MEVVPLGIELEIAFAEKRLRRCSSSRGVSSAKRLDRRWDREKIRRYALQHTWDRVAERVFTVWTEVVGDAR